MLYSLYKSLSGIGQKIAFDKSVYELLINVQLLYCFKLLTTLSGCSIFFSQFILSLLSCFEATKGQGSDLAIAHASSLDSTQDGTIMVWYGVLQAIAESHFIYSWKMFCFLAVIIIVMYKKGI